MSSFQNDFGIVRLHRKLKSSFSSHNKLSFKKKNLSVNYVVLKEELTEIIKILTDTMNIELSCQFTLVLLCAITQIKM